MVVDCLEDAVRRIRGLRLGQPGAVVGSVDDTSDFMEAIYVPSKVDEAVTEFLNESEPAGKLFILLGSAGDGKTAIFGRAFRESNAEWLQEDHINLDATESTSVTRTKSEQLRGFLEPVAANLGQGGEPNQGLAINLGHALNFFRSEDGDDFDEIWEAIEAARDPQNFESGCIYRSDAGIVVANLSHRRLFDTHPERLGDGLLMDIVERFDHTHAGFPLESVSEEVSEAATKHPVAYNLDCLTDESVRRSIVRLLAAKAIISNEYLNPRRILDYVSRMVVPPELDPYLREDPPVSFEGLAEQGYPLEDVYLWNTVYDILSGVGTDSVRLDPCTVFSLDIDEEILSLRSDGEEGDGTGDIPSSNHLDPASGVRTIIRKRQLEDGEYLTEEWSPRFEQFIATRTVFDDLCPREALPTDAANDALKTVKSAIKRWSRRSAETDLVQIADGLESVEFRFFSELESDLRPEGDFTQRTTEETQLGRIWFTFNDDVVIPLSYELYKLLALITEGFNADAIDRNESEGVRLLNSQISELTKKDSSLQIWNAEDGILLTIEKQSFGETVVIR